MAVAPDSSSIFIIPETYRPGFSYRSHGKELIAEFRGLDPDETTDALAELRALSEENEPDDGESYPYRILWMEWVFD